MYHSEDSLEKSEIIRKAAAARRKSSGGVAKKVKQELISASDQQAARRAGSSKFAARVEEYDSLNSDGYVAPQSQASGQGGSGMGDETLPRYVPPRDPAPISAVNTFTRTRQRKRLEDIGLGEEDESGTL